MIAAGSPLLFLDARAEIDKLFFGDDLTHSGFAFEIILRHNDKLQRCYCWDAVKQGADSQCKRCRGKGWLVYDKIHRTVKKKFIGTQEIATVGPMHFDSALYFFRHDVIIGEGDVIREAKVDERGFILNPVTILTNLVVRDVEYVKGNLGRVEFITTYCNKSE